MGEEWCWCCELDGMKEIMYEGKDCCSILNEVMGCKCGVALTQQLPPGSEL